MTATQGLCIPSFLDTRSGVYAGNEMRGRAVQEGAVGCFLASMAGRVREGERGFSPPSPRVRSGRRAAPDGLQAGRSGSIRRAAGQYGRARMHERGRRAHKDMEPDPARAIIAGTTSVPRSTA